MADADQINNVKKFLSTLVKKDGHSEIIVSLGEFTMSLRTNDYYSVPPNIEHKNITKYDFITIRLSEIKVVPIFTWEIPLHVQIDLYNDYRFKALKLGEHIKKEYISIDELCRLIIQINKLLKLSAFK